jgi:UDPglucose 6-dehydrogenase
LLDSGADVVVHDPIAGYGFSRLVTDEPLFADDMYGALEGADALVVVTDWKAYREADLAEVMRRMRGNVVVDGRNIWAGVKRPEQMDYDGIGLGTQR